MNTILSPIADRFSRLAQVEAIALAGSQATAQAGPASDFDLYIYTRQDISAADRLAIGREFSPNAQVVDYWGPAMEWDDPGTGTHIDTVFFDAAWMRGQVERSLIRCEASAGYSTCFWHTVRVSQPLHDSNGWFASLQALAREPYPELLMRRILAMNVPLLRDSFSSYRRQIAKAAQRGDLVDLQIKATNFLASVFDILFALNRIPHPGEKRLIDWVERGCSLRPPQLRQHIQAMLAGIADDPPAALAAVDELTTALESLLRREGAWPVTVA